MTFEQSTLWKSTLGNTEAEAHSKELAILRDLFLDMRSMTEVLVRNVSSDLSNFTIHDVTHLDALWSVASEIVGNDYIITPTEAFVLGGAFLLHDAGMCVAAYPGGIEEIKKHDYWEDIISRHSKKTDIASIEEINSAVREFLRINHAERAQFLPTTEWITPDNTRYNIIQKPEFRQKFGQFIGEVAASHWWDHEELLRKLDRVIPAPPPFPTEWRIDLLKVACILRVADAAQIDERRAPGFVWAQRHLEPESAKHWLFQNRLTQPERRGDALHYSATAHFAPSEAEAWWLAYDTLRMVDEELRKTDVLIADSRGDEMRFAAKRVANAESASRMMNSISASGWIPVDTAIRISDVTNLIGKLGGEALYGKNGKAALRELVQNAIDATRIKSVLLETPPENTGNITIDIGQDQGKWFLKVSDKGIGMSESTIINSLLSFGESGWKGSYNFLSGKLNSKCIDDVTIGKYGIGFFAVFMVGNEVEIVTRQFDKSFSDTLVLKFSGGLGQRPVLRQAERHERLIDGGTSVKVWLNEHPRSPNGILGTQATSAKTICGKIFPTVDITFNFLENGKLEVIKGGDWRNLEIEDILKKINGISEIPNDVREFVVNARTITNEKGIIVANMFIGREPFRPRIGDDRLYGVVTSRGVSVMKMTSLFGVIEGEVTRASRDTAQSAISAKKIREWATEQATLISNMNLDHERQAEFSSIIRSLGGKTANLKICLSEDGWMSVNELKHYLSRHEEVFVVQDARIAIELRKNKGGKILKGVIGVAAGLPAIVQSSSPQTEFEFFQIEESWMGKFSGRTLEGLVAEIICDEWNLDKETVSEFVNAISNGRNPYDTLMGIISNQEGNIINGTGSLFKRTMKKEDLVKLEERTG